jgi:hypothetical protein
VGKKPMISQANPDSAGKPPKKKSDAQGGPVECEKAGESAYMHESNPTQYNPVACSAKLFPSYGRDHYLSLSV